MKTKEELNAIKQEDETMSKSPDALTDDELGMVAGGASSGSSGTEYSDSSNEYFAVLAGICPHCRGNLFGRNEGKKELGGNQYSCFNCYLEYEIVYVGEELIPSGGCCCIRKIYKLVEYSR